MIETGTDPIIKKIVLTTPTPWSGGEASNMAFYLRSQRLFFNLFGTINWSKPLWDLDELRTRFDQVAKYFQFNFREAIVWWEVGLNGLHIHFMIKGREALPALRDKLRTLGQIYLKHYKAPLPFIQAHYFRKRVARSLKNEPLSEALMQGWSKLKGCNNWERILLFRGGEEITVFSPLAYIPRRLCEKVLSLNFTPKSLIELKTDKAHLERGKDWLKAIMKYSPSCVALISSGRVLVFQVWGRDEISPMLVEWARIRALNVGSIRTARVKSEPGPVLQKVLAGHVLREEGMLSLALITSKSQALSVEGRIRAEYNYRGPSQNKLYSKLEGKGAGLIEMKMPDTTFNSAKEWALTIRKRLREEGLTSSLTLKYYGGGWVLAGTCEEISIFKATIGKEVSETSPFKIRVKKYRLEALVPRAYIASLPSHPSYDMKTSKFTTT